MAIVAWWRPAAPRPRRFKAIADYINATFPNYVARISTTTVDTSTKPAGLRYLTRKGKGRKGTVLVVCRREKDGLVQVYRHNNAETYRSGYEVEEWVRDEEKRLGLPPSHYGPTADDFALLRRATLPDGVYLGHDEKQARATAKRLVGRGLVHVRLMDYEIETPKTRLHVWLTDIGDRFLARLDGRDAA